MVVNVRRAGIVFSTGWSDLGGGTAISHSLEDRFAGEGAVRDLFDGDNSVAEARLSWREDDLRGLRFFNFAVRACAFEPTFAMVLVSVSGELGCERLDLSFASMVTVGKG